MRLNSEVINSVLPVELIFVPNYIVSALKSRNSNLADFESNIKIVLHRYVEGKPMDGVLPNVSIAKQYILSKLSRIDIEDMVILNNRSVLRLDSNNNSDSFFETLCKLGDKPIMFTGSETERVYKTIETLYDNTMRILDNEISLPFDIHIGTDCLIVILNSGFTNYIINNDSNTKLYIVGKLLNAVVKSFGEDRAKASYIFRKYLELLKLVSVVNK